MSITTFLSTPGSVDYSELAGKKILFANFPADGHFNPLTGIAVHLKSIGCDVRWYTSPIYADKLRKLQIRHYPFKIAKDVNIEAFDLNFPERAKIKGAIKKLNFDLINAFILRSPEYYADIMEIYKVFPFEMMICDCAFTGIPFVADKMNLPVVSVGVFPLVETSKDLPPSGLAMTPSYSFLGKIKQSFLRYLAANVLFGKANKILRTIMDKYDIDHFGVTAFDLLAKKSTLLLQSGTPGFEYSRSDLSKNVRFVGALLPHQSKKQTTPWYDERLDHYQKVVLVTQGTVEKNTEKIITPVLEAFKDTDTLVIATTGGTGTADLKKRFPEKNLIIADFIPFADVMPYANVYVTNGGYGGVMLGIENQLPLVVAGIHEGKNEINARIGYFKLGVNLKKEWPSPAQIKKAIEEATQNAEYRRNVIELSREFDSYNPNELCTRHIAEILGKRNTHYTVVQGKELLPDKKSKPLTYK